MHQSVTMSTSHTSKAGMNGEFANLVCSSRACAACGTTGARTARRLAFGKLAVVELAPEEE